ncbi:MAG: BrnT family toxin [Pseudomonadota bacterium]|jgi:uncharacterized DUF497 family protein
MRDVEFEWDSDKADANVRKHGVSFELAANVFGDPNRLEEDDRFSEGEYRVVVIGLADSRFLTVVYTDRSEGEREIIRIISARKSTTHEIRAYHGDH